ncbi:GGDEF domain-containing protein [Conexibacter sp. JD483]|uniref:GGDEF domain-containing protein n=1 Tax=unclassified Conexibacter TaxID=2627773 RepID=UPI00271FA674|nr:MULTISPECIES: GGDEF domain-containing protein [unclassified Conexibacter]MDO8188156.1 GGDEF domain-containing protein [Conexibacter sp. CPCC 205706]MDO8201280.1 GGDEF domain-containing protein [Conexibacter sp. CPCC 205762]MDR9370448.1 GGDEF domain-containing protein [Conexibacter sp. JD483]
MSEDPLPQVLEVVADTVLHAAGYRTVVFNVYRPQWDDYEATLVVGQQACREQLLGSTTPLELLRRLLAQADRRAANVFFFRSDGGSSAWSEIEQVYVPEIAPSADPQAWTAEDALLVTLTDVDGSPLGFMSMDEPASGQRPGDGDLRLLRVICSYAEQALRAARRARTAEVGRLELERLSQVSAQLVGCASSDAVDRLLATTIEREFGFARVTVYRSDGVAAPLAASMRRGGDERPPPLQRSAVAAVLAATARSSGCWLLAARDLLPAEHVRSPSNGRGPRGWSDHCLLAPWYAAGELAGLVIAQDPVDRLIPTEERCQSIALLIDLAAAAHRGVLQRESLDRLAGHDALTGLRNRRGLDALIAAQPGVALLLCDLDHFKRVNDDHGHDAGDRVLERFGELLREHAREQDVPIRLGGEEFLVVLPNTDHAGALAAAERLRAATTASLAGLVPGGVTVSIGVALDGSGTLDARRLLDRADRGLYLAKQRGRNQTAIAID